jgi:thioredoxin reductase (NADPH)
MDKTHDVILIGGGPAALAAGVYAGRAELKTLILERLWLGGQIALTDAVDNYPGFPDGIDGAALTELMRKQVEKFHCDIRTETAERVELDGDLRIVATNKARYAAPAVILAMGADPRKIGCPGEDRLRGAGVSYCATCDGAFFKGKRVVVVGGGDSAFKEGLFLTRFASEVLLIHRRQGFRAEKIYLTQAQKNPTFGLLLDSVVESINGAEKVESVTVRNVTTAATQEVATDGVFIFIGHVPNTAFLANLFPEHAGRLLPTDAAMQTSIPGIYAIGDVREGSYMQVATAVGEGATAAIAAEQYIANLEARGQ